MMMMMAMIVMVMVMMMTRVDDDDDDMMVVGVEDVHTDGTRQVSRGERKVGRAEGKVADSQQHTEMAPYGRCGDANRAPMDDKPSSLAWERRSEKGNYSSGLVVDQAIYGQLE